MPNRQRTLRNFLSATGAQGPAAPARLAMPAAAPADVALAPRAGAGDSARGDEEAPKPPRDESSERWSEAAATSPSARSHDTNVMPIPWGVKAKQDALRGVVTCFDPEGRCSHTRRNTSIAQRRGTGHDASSLITRTW